jgi:hypothetical protein
LHNIEYAALHHSIICSIFAEPNHVKIKIRIPNVIAITS